MPLVDLRPMGDPVCHYAVRVKRLRVNDLTVGEGSTIYAIVDTGTTGGMGSSG